MQFLLEELAIAVGDDPDAQGQGTEGGEQFAHTWLQGQHGPVMAAVVMLEHLVGPALGGVVLTEKDLEDVCAGDLAVGTDLRVES